MSELNITVKKKGKKRGPCVKCGKWTTCKEDVTHEKWDNEWRESFLCWECDSAIGQ
jgi:hypothetical protein